MEHYHLRVTCPNSEALDIAEAFINNWMPEQFVFCNEVSKKGVEHFHAHLSYLPGNAPSKSTRSDWFSEMGLKGCYYMETIKKNKTEADNIVYVIKCKDYILWNMDLKEYEIRTDEINEDKKIDIKEKLLNRIQPKLEVHKETKELIIETLDIGKPEIIIKTFYNISLRDIAKYIKDIYIEEFDKLPPTKSLMFQYSVYVAQKLKICDDEIEQIYDNIF